MATDGVLLVAGADRAGADLAGDAATMTGQPTFWQSLVRYQSAGFGDTPPWLNWLFWLVPRLLVCAWGGHNRNEITDWKTGEFTCYCCDVCGECWGGSWDQ